MKKLIPLMAFGVLALNSYHVVSASEVNNLETVYFEEKTTVNPEDYTIEIASVLSLGAPKFQLGTRSIVGEGINFTVNSYENRVSMVVDIEPMLASSYLIIPINLNDGNYIELAYDSEGNTDGSILIFNQYEESIGTVHVKALAKNVELISSVEIIDNSTLVVDLSYLKEIDEFMQVEIEAHTATINDYFSSRSWIHRDGRWSLSLRHRPYLTNSLNGSSASTAKRTHSWSLVHAHHANDTHWRNTNNGGMRDQYNCHFNTIGGLKPLWNLEPARTDVGYAATVVARCNP